jgi:threonine aldolase
LENNIARLAEDHAHAKLVADACAKKNFIGAILPVETNILIFEVLPPFTAMGLVAKLAEKDIKCVAISSTQIRMVFHLDVTEKMVDELVKFIAEME